VDTDSNDVYRAPAEFIDSDHPAIRAFVANSVPSTASATEKACRCYLAAREIRYDTDLDYADPEIFRASSVLQLGYGYCVGKASLFAALCRASGLAARVAFADVTNHLCSERLHEKMGSNYFAWHGLGEVLIDDRWLQASPTFNASLCARFGVPALDFDGASNALLQAYDGEGRTFMRYEVMHGSFHDVPAKFLIAELALRYPKLKRQGARRGGGMENEIPLATT